MTDQRRLLVTSALPYANGPIHLGHILEHTQTDIFVRFQRMRNHECVYVCADDVHGTAVMLNAEAAGQDPLDYALAITEAHKVDFAAFDISHNWYDTTHSSENRALATSIYERLRASGNIKKSDVAQLFDPQKGLFLADRFVIGECPKCHASDQYGDNCDACGATYAATDLINPISKLSGVTPELKTSEHVFFALSQHAEFLSAWTTSGALHPAIANKLSELLVS